MLLDIQNAELLRKQQSLKRFDKEQLSKMRVINREAFAQAIKETDTQNWQKNIPIIQVSIANLGKKIGYEYTKIFGCIEEKEEFVLCASKWLRIGVRETQLTWMGWIASGLVEDNAITRNYADKFEEGHEDGLVYAVHMKFSEYSDAIQKEGKFKNFGDPNLMYCIALIWLLEADALMSLGNVEEALNRIADAYAASQLATQNVIIDECHSHASSSAASRAANARHTDTYELRCKIINFWRDNISPDKSNEFTAELLQKEFPEVSHRTLARYVSEAKKLPPDVKPGECPFYESQ